MIAGQRGAQDMCGRYESWVDDDEIGEILDMEKQGSAARYLKQGEVYPGTVQPVLYGSRIRVRAHLSRWGLTLPQNRGEEKTGADAQLRMDADGELTVPEPDRGGGRKTFINLRAETVCGRSRFAGAFRGEPEDRLRRVLVPVSAYYEWSGGVKYRIADGTGDLLYLCGLEEDDGELLRENAPDPKSAYACFSSAAMIPGRPDAETRRAAGDPGRRHVILTAPAEGEAARIHTRMPLFVSRSDCGDWLYDSDFARDRLSRPWGRPLSVREA